jgi:hypothetical protein
MTDKQRAKRLFLLYDLLVPDFDKIEQYQKGVCYLCGRKQRSGKRLAVDHEHFGLGRVRGLLCSGCNRFLGQIEIGILRAGLAHIPIITLLRRVIEYLMSHPVTEALGREVYTFPGKFGTKRHREYLAKKKRAIIPAPLGEQK